MSEIRFTQTAVACLIYREQLRKENAFFKMTNRGKILLTGGLGYIGSHISVELLQADYDIIIVDNLSNSHIETVNNIKKIEPSHADNIEVQTLDLRHENLLQAVFEENNILAVIHLAGSKAVGESVTDPLLYYDNNVSAAISLLKVMKQNNVKNLLFSSSATVYGKVETPCISEDFPTKPYNPYGRTKWIIEQVLFDLQNSDSNWNTTCLRYFNPAGAHSSGLIGDRIDNKPNNLFPIICEVLTNRRDRLSVYGNDYKTRDGTGERDYIHICDLASAHLAALDHLLKSKGSARTHIFNIGSGRGNTVLEVINTFNEVLAQPLPYEFSDRRAGDIDCYYADPRMANQILGWETKHDLKKMCIDTCRWLDAVGSLNVSR